ncbi:hypothetical protein RSOLAG1IB_11069 [Rhizoctonia solani AG-1 IB]|uniref:Uncharacterized protein n=1 Tax=Thanatephorus cucumeris (strain AG1-IB / isolate 7/3/14) TaxID=1108050 RepID=A0A0B7F3T5_THACB|nr:hypothetical protein RSOLAG1IB_11069 [Rhizoctonia solani AG-1 IB]
MWCTRWYLPLLLLPFPSAPPFFLLVLIFSLTLHARPCLYCIVLLVALFTSSCYWAPTPLDIPSHALESIYPSLATSRPTIDLQSLLNASEPVPTPSVAASTPRVTYSARLERPKRCWCSPQNIFEPFNTTRWDQRASVLVFVKQGFWDWLVEQEESDQTTDTTASQQTTSSEQVDESSTTASPTSTTTNPTSWRTKWNALSSYFSSRSVEQKNEPTPKNRPENKVKPPVRAPLEVPKPTPTPTPTATPTATPTEATPTQTLASAATEREQEKLPWWQKQYDLRPHGGGVVVDFKWGRG